MKLFSAKHICARYGEAFALRDASVDINCGSITGILGPNGCGKTTLLKAICGILPHEGKSVLDGLVLEDLKPKQLAAVCGYIPQRSGLGIDLRVLDVVMMGFYAQLRPLQPPSPQMQMRALAVLESVGLRGYADRNYQELSEGQKQMCVWARAMASECAMLILDEPESALDFHQRRAAMRMLQKWTDSGKRCALVTLHDPQLAINACERLILMREGRCIDLLRPQCESIESMQRKLKQIYESVLVRKICDQYVLLEDYEA